MKFTYLFAFATAALAAPAPFKNPIFEGVKDAIENAVQVSDTLTEQLKDGSHDFSSILSAGITGLDSQIDNAINTVSTALGPFTLGISNVIGGVLLGPFVQSVTNGAEVVLSNLIGLPGDAIGVAAVSALTGNYSKLIKFAKGYTIDTTRLENVNRRISNTLPKHA